MAQPTELEVNPLDTVRAVVEKVAAVQAVDPNSISLMHDGEALPMDRTLKNCGIKEGASLKAMPRDPVGGVDSSPVLSLSEITRKRLMNEALRIRDAGIPLHAASPLVWEGTIAGRGRWRGKTYRIRILLPPNYPTLPPIVEFVDLPRPQHPNISSAGVCYNHLREDWNPQYNLVSIYEGLNWLFENPNYGSALPPDAPTLARPRRNALDELREMLREMGRPPRW